MGTSNVYNMNVYNMESSGGVATFYLLIGTSAGQCSLELLLS